MKNKYSLAIGMVALAVLLVALCVPVNRVQAADPATTGVNAQIDFATTTTCPACKATGVTWQELPQISKTTTLAKGGHYYVPAGGLVNTSMYSAAAKGTYCIHLNGQSISSSGQVLDIVSNSEVHIFGSGTVTGNTGKTENRLGSVAKITTAKLFLHGGTYTTGGAGNVIHLKASTSYVTYGQLHLYDGATITGGNVTSADLGGNVHVEVGVFTMHGGTISGGSAKAGGNLYTNANGSFTMTGGTITGGKATGDGGNVYLRKGATLSGGSVTNGTAGNMGGNLLLRSATYKLSGVNVSGGKAASGGNIMLYGSANATMSAGKVEQGKGTYSGGNFYMGNNDAKLTLTGGTVSGGNAPKGGNVYVHLGTLDVNGGTVQNGTGTSGGNVYLRTNMNMLSGTITGGSATNGGNIYMYAAAAEKDKDGNVVTAAETNKAVLTVSGGTISKGSATASGGNVYSSSYSNSYAFTITMSGGSFEGGSADNGGSVYLTYTKMNMSAGTISGGKASTAGNVYAATGGQFTMTGGTVTAGQGGSETDSAGKGGNFYLSSLNSKVTIKNGTVSNGSATDLGGNICVNNGNLTITGGTVSGGQAQDGGNIYNYAGTNKQAYETNNTTVGDDAADEYPAPVITGGVASVNGGNILNDGRFVLGNCTISDGVATKYGAQFYLDTNTKLIVRADYAGECMLYMPTALQPNPLYGGKVANFTGEGLFPGKLILGNLTGDPLLVGRENDTGLYVSSAALIGKDGSFTWYADNATMMADYNAETVSYIQPASGQFPLNGQTVTVDLVNQNVNFTGTGTVTCYDSANDYYRYCGSATFGEKVVLANAVLHQVGNKHYYALNEEGTYSFRRLELTLPSISLRPSAGGLYYTGQWHCDEVLAKHIDTFGVAVSLVDMPGTDFATDTDTMWTESLGSEFTSGTKKCGVLINRILKDASHGADGDRIAKNAEYAMKPIHAVAYVTIDGNSLVSYGMSYSLHDVLTSIDMNITHYATSAATMREFITHWNANGLTGNDWAFTFAVSEDIVKLNTLYSGRNAYHGEMHNHADTGGTSDGKITLDRWIEGMEKLDMDFATIVDHKQSLHMQLPEWTNDIFVGGSELSVNVTDSGGKGNFHYNMIFSNVEDFEKVLFAFPELAYKQDATTGEWHFTYPKMTRARMEEVIAAILDNNGQFVHVHPKYDKYLTADDPLVYWFADYTGLEITTGTGGNMMAKDNQEGYELWTQLLALGKKVYATAGSDNHAMPNTAALTSMYSTAKNADAHLDNMRKGNFAAGSVGIRMAVGDTIMGGETGFDGQRLMVSVGDFHNSAVFADHTYKVEIYQDDQVVHTAAVTPGATFYHAMDADKDAGFYRVVVWDETLGARIAVGNPIWNVK